MLSAMEHIEMIGSKWNVMQNVLCILNSAERHFKRASFVFLRMDYDCVYWQWILKSHTSNTRGFITEPSEGTLEVKIITPMSKKQTKPETLCMLCENKLIFSGVCILTERQHHAFRHYKNFFFFFTSSGPNNSAEFSKRGKMFTFTPVGLLVNVAFLLPLVVSCINHNWRENNSKFGFQRGQRDWEALFTY